MPNDRLDVVFEILQRRRASQRPPVRMMPVVMLIDPDTFSSPASLQLDKVRLSLF